MNQNFIDFMRPWTDKQVAVAVSGGADSMALMHMMNTLGVPFVVLHVNHKLRPNADRDAAMVLDAAKQMGHECHILCWSGPKPTHGIEDAARAARYRLMGDYCRHAGIDTLFVAHHGDDQIETFLMNLARGSGLNGLAAMRSVSHRDGMTIVRPLLEWRRADLRRYCDQNQIAYVHDEMNDDERYARVRMRMRRHVLADELGIRDDRILLAIKNLGRTRAAVDDYIAQRMDGIIQNDRAVFNVFFLFDEAMDIRLKLLGNLLHRIGGKDYQPRLVSLERALNKLGHDCQFTLAGCVVRRFKNRVLIAREGAKTTFRARKGNENTKQNNQT